MKKQNFNLHTHTYRCGHAIGKDIDYIETAIKAGFNILGFSEHIQYRINNGKYNRINFEDFKSYFEIINKLKNKYSDKITIYCGLEAEYFPNAIDDLLELEPNCNFILLGQHQGGLNNKKYCLKCDDRDVLQYAEDIENALETGLYSIVAHPDFFMNTRNKWNKECIRASEQICLAAKKHNIPLELNIKGSYGNKKFIENSMCFPYPFREFWEIAATVENDVIYGWDAHKPDDLFRKTNNIDPIIKDLNLHFINDIKNCLIHE